MKKYIYLLILIFYILLFGCSKNETIQLQPELKQIKEGKPKVLYIDSYHTDLPWVKGIMRGLFSELKISYNSLGEWDDTDSPVDFKVFHMNTKKNQTPEFIKESASQARLLIESWSPDLVIVSDDNAMKYVVTPFYLNKELPIVFCGVNWSASDYGLPADNITGMIEVQLIEELVEELSHYARGTKVGFLKGGTFSARKEGEYFQKTLDVPLENVFVNDYESWKENFIRLQQDVDILLLGNLNSLADWDSDRSELKTFLLEKTEIPTGTWDMTESDLVLITYATIPEEQGEWAADTALKILKGETPSSIPLTKNKKVTSYLNMTMAKKLQVRFPLDLIERSHFSRLKTDEKRLLFVNSYHKGYGWSDGIERGLNFILEKSLSDIDLKVIRMDTKRKNSPEQIALSVKNVLEEIESWNPHIIIGSDDNFFNYVARPILYNKELPVIACGLNGNATDYGLPAKNITAILEDSLYVETINKLIQLSYGDRVGVIALDTPGERNAVLTAQMQGAKLDEISFVNTWQEWQSEYLRLQKSVDMLILFSPMGIKNWDEERAVDFIRKNTLIPSGITLEDQIQYALLGQAKISEEQGWLAGEMALKVLDGTPISELPLTHNRQSKNMINISLANDLGIIIPQDLMTGAELWSY